MTLVSPKSDILARTKGLAVHIGNFQKNCKGLFSCDIARNKIEERHPLKQGLKPVLIAERDVSLSGQGYLFS